MCVQIDLQKRDIIKRISLYVPGKQQQKKKERIKKSNERGWYTEMQIKERKKNPFLTIKSLKLH